MKIEAHSTSSVSSETVEVKAKLALALARVAELEKRIIAIMTRDT